MDGEKYKVNDRSATGAAAEVAFRQVAFDGATYQLFDYSAGRLYVQRIKPGEEKPANAFLQFSNYFFQAFEFLAVRDDVGVCDR
jgi:hypothetical protein